MALDYKNSLTELRQRVPVGIKQALKLLQETCGDVEKAEDLFKASCVEIVRANTGASAELSTRCLVATSFNIPLAMGKAETAIYTLTERIIRKHQSKEDGLDVLATAIETAHGLKREFWFSPEDLQLLNKQQFCFMLVHEWIGYEDWEDFYSALTFHVAEVSAQIEQTLQLPALAAILLKAYQRQLFIKSKVVASSFSDLSTIVAKDAVMMECQEHYARHRSMLLDALHAYVMQHICYFP